MKLRRRRRWKTLWMRIVRLALALSADWKEFAFLQEEPEMEDENPIVVNATHTIEHPGKYIVTLNGVDLDPGSVFLNGEEVLTVYGRHVDASVTVYAITGDTIEVVGSEHHVMKVEYA